MKALKREIRYRSRSTVFTIYNIADLHIGSRSFCEQTFLQTIEEIKANPYALVVLDGDLGEYIAYSDKRFNSEDVHPDLLFSLDAIGEWIENKIAEYLWPIRKKILFITKGNHEWSYEQHSNQRITENLCKRLQIPEAYGGWACMMRIMFARTKKTGKESCRTFTIFGQHGYSSARTQGAITNVLSRLPQQWEADLYVIAHAHYKLCTIVPRMALGGIPLRLVEKPMALVCCGSYKRSYQKDVITYSERKGYPPAGIGCVKVRYKPDTGELWEET